MPTRPSTSDPVRHVPVGVHVAVDIGEDARRHLADHPVGAGDRVVARPHRDRHVAVARREVRVGRAEPQAVHVVGGLGPEAQDGVGVEDELPLQVLEGLSVRDLPVDVVDLRERDAHRLPPHRLGIRGRHRLRIDPIGEGVDDLRDAADPVDVAIVLGIALLIVAPDHEVRGARLDHVLERGEAAPAVHVEDARGASLDLEAALGLAAHVGIVGRILHGHPGLGHARADHVLVVVREASARERRDGEQPGDRDRVVHARVQIDSQAAVAHDPVEVGEGRLRLVQESRQPRDGLPHAEELDLRRPLQLGGDRRREVLVPEHVGGEAERIPPLADEDIRLRVLAGPITEPVAVLPVHEVVGGDIGVELEGQPRRDLPVVLCGAEAAHQGNVEPLAVLRIAQDLRDEEAAGAAAGALGHDVAVLALDPHAPPGVGVEGHGQILAVADRPEEGDLEERALGARVADLGIQEARLPLAPDGRAEERKERDDRDVPHPERSAGAVEGVVEIGRRGAELERPDRIVALAGGERPAADLVDALADALHPLAGEVIVGRRRGRAVVDDPGAGLEVVVHPVPDEPILAVEEDDLALGDGFTGIAVQLDAIREEPGRPLGDLDIAGRDEQVVGAAHLLDLIGDDAAFLSPAADGHGRRGQPVPMPRARRA